MFKRLSCLHLTRFLGGWISLVGLFSPGDIAAQGSRSDYERAMSLTQRTENKVFRSNVRLRWLPDGKRFWYKVQTSPETSEWVIVDADQGARTVTNAAPEAEVALTSQAGIDLPQQSRRTGDETELTF